MKIILSLFLISLFTQVDWIEESDRLIKEIDSEAKLIVDKNMNENDEIVEYRKSKLNDFVKTEFVIKSTILETMQFEYNVYQENKFIIASYELSVFPLFYKGAKNVDNPNFVMEESKKYFKNDTLGIQFRRTINGFENENTDSLKIELAKIPFDEKPLTKDDYLKEVDYFKRTKKLFR